MLFKIYYYFTARGYDLLIDDLNKKYKDFYSNNYLFDNIFTKFLFRTATILGKVKKHLKKSYDKIENFV